MAADFSHLSKGNIDPSKFVDFVFAELEGEVTLHVTSATEANKKYTNERLRRHSANKSRTRQIEAGRINAGHLEESRDDDRELFALFVVHGWVNVLDAQGREVSFSRDNCRAFLEALPWQIFDELRAFCHNVANFTPIPENAEVVAGNSGTGLPIS